MLRRLLTIALAAAALVTVAAPAEAQTFLCVYGGIVYDDLGEFTVPGNVGMIPTVCVPVLVPIPQPVRDVIEGLPDPL